jgi:Chaperone of endosialidase
MGKTFMGGATHEGNVDLLTPEQKQFLSGILGPNAGQASQAYGQMLQPYNPEQFQDFYQKSFIDPAQQVLQRQIIPGLKENFLGLDESGSSALNRALAQSATDVSTALGSGILGQYNQYQANRLSALSGLGGLAGSQTFQPMISQSQGILGPLIGAAGTVGGAALLSSREYKENIRPFLKGLEALKAMQAYRYDYKPEYSNRKDQVGVMVEDSPLEIVDNEDGMKMINIYGLAGLLVNAVNELRAKVEELEKKGG